MNTKMLLDITRDLEMSGQGESDQSHSYNELLRMYKYLLEENDGLKKELLLLQRGQRDREREEGKSKKESKAERKQKLNESETEKHRNREKDQDKDKGTKKLNRK